MLNTDVFSGMMVKQFHESQSSSTPIPRWEDKRIQFINSAKGKMAKFSPPTLNFGASLNAPTAVAWETTHNL